MIHLVIQSSQISMSAPPIMETVHKYVPIPMEATTVHATLAIY